MFDSSRSRLKRRRGKLESAVRRAKKRHRLAVEPLEDRRLLAVLPLADLHDGGAADEDGFALTSTSPQDLTGFSVSTAGDINRDGFDDLLVAAPADNLLGAPPGHVYVVYGKATGFTDVGLSTIFGDPDGATLFGIANDDHAGFSVSAAGDVNADGYHDFVIGAPYADTETFVGTGQAYLVFGTPGDLPASLGLLDGSNGFLMQGLLGFDRAGFSVDTAGDINGDGYDDLVIGTPSDDAENPTAIGQAYVIYGKADGFAAQVNLWELVGESGFPLFGLNAGDHLGSAVSTVGDVNGDGFDDFAVGAPYADRAADSGQGSAYIIFGGTAPAAGVNILDGSNGFRVDGFIPFERAGFSISSAGDFNGDGFDDVLIGAPGDRNDPFDPFDYANPAGAGRGYVIFGKGTDFDPVINLANVDITGDGFSITGIDGLADGDGVDYAGFSVSSAGDVDGDGFDDIILGAPYVDTGTTGVGEAYLIYGRGEGFPDGLTLASLSDDQGMQLVGERSLDRAGHSVSAAGDVNGDGFDDVIIGSPSVFPDSGRAGRAHVLFGQDFRSKGADVGDETANNLLGDGTDNSLIGGQGDDSLAGGGGADVLRGGQGDDTVLISDLLFRRVDGGRGDDTLKVIVSDLTLDLSAIPDNRLRGIERIDISGGGINELVIGTVQEVLNISDTSNQLIVLRDGEDPVNIGDGWTEVAPQAIDGKTFRVYEQGAATLLVQDAPPELDLNGENDGGINFAAAYTEDEAAVAIVDADLLIVDDGDLTAATATITNLLDGSSEAVDVTLGSSGLQATYFVATGTLEITGAASPAVYEGVLRTLTYVNASQRPTTTDRLITVTVDDGIATSSAATSTVSVTAVNDAPEMVNAPSLIAVGIVEDATDPAGTSVDALVPAGKIRDADGGVLDAIAVINVDNTNGTWQYKTDGDWMDFGAPTESEARLLDAAAQFRFVPATDFFGIARMRLRAWDQTSGTVGGTADVIANGGTTAFSNQLATATASVTPVNDAPLLDSTASPTLTPIFEDDTNSPGTQVSALIPDGAITDPDGVSVEAIAVIAVDNANGRWEHSSHGQTWLTMTASVASSQLLGAAHWVRFIPNAAYHGTATFEFRAWDQTSGTSGDTGDTGDTTTTGGTTAFSDASDLAEITIQPVDDPPTIDPISDFVLVGGVATHEVSLAGITDGDERLESVDVTANTANSALVESIAIAHTSPDMLGTATLAFAADTYGQAAITIIVTEQDGQATSESFLVTVSDPTKVWQNPASHLDIDNSGFIVPLDALLVINALNKRDLIDDVNRLQLPPPEGFAPPFLDPSGDGFLTPLDVLQVINFLNARASAEAESSAMPNEVVIGSNLPRATVTVSPAVHREREARGNGAVQHSTSFVPHTVARASHDVRQRVFADLDANDDEALLDALLVDEVE